MRLSKSLTAGAVGAAMAIGALAAAPQASAEDTVRLNMPATFPSRLVILGTLGTKLTETVDAVSGGELRLTYHEPGALVPALEVFDATANGSVEAAWSVPGYWTGKNMALALFSAVPFGPSASEYLAWIYHGGGHELMNDIYHRNGLHSLICGVIAPEASGWFREEIKTVEDLQGLKMRFFGLGARVMQRLGVDTQLLAGGDIYPALERGTIDATEFSMPAIDLDLGFYQIAKHYYFPGWHQQSTLQELLLNKDTWDNLSPRNKAILETACRANVTDALALGEAIQGRALAELQDKGVTIHRWPDEILERLEAEWNAVAEEESAVNPDFKAAWDSLQAFRAEYAIWRELGYL